MASWPYNTATWKRLRLAKLARDPFCHACQLRGRHVAARAVDHDHAVADGGHPFPTLDGLTSYCERCHNEKTNAVDRPDRHGSGRRVKGFDVHGNPVDPDDAWHRGGLRDQKPAAQGPVGDTRTDIVPAINYQKGGE